MIRRLNTARACRMWLALAMLSNATIASAQEAAERPRWSFSQEVGAIVGATYFEGPRIATVSSVVGASVGIGLQRAIRPELVGGALLRAGLSPVDASEAGQEWSLGTLREVSALGLLSMDSGKLGQFALRLDAAGGVTVPSGLGNTLPFRDLSVLLPTAEAGASIGRTPVDGRRQWWLTARAGFLRMNTTPGNAVITGGWGTRFLVGVRTVK